MSSADEQAMWFDKVEGEVRSVRRLVIFDDGSACIEDGDAVEVIFEEDPDAWRDAIRYLENQGYSECGPPGGDTAAG